MAAGAQVTGPLDPRTWFRDGWLWAALIVGLLLRAGTLAEWPQFECLRDECIYRGMAVTILEGRGLETSNKGWLPSPGYPYLMAACRSFLGSMFALKIIQVFLSGFSNVVTYGITFEVADRRAARVAAWLFALNPTIAWFTNTWWIETVYIFFLTAAVIWMLAARRTQEIGHAVVSGMMIGAAVLFRGVATYLPPFWVLAAIYPEGDPFRWESWRDSARERWKLAAAFSVAAVLTVAPYSLYGSTHYGGFMITDATAGHVLYLGNNDFPPLTFDYGNGMLTQPVFEKYLASGRRPCNRDVPPVQSSACEVSETMAWTLQHPVAWMARIPVRLAQMFNPNSFLTRHVRWGYWPGFPWWAKELLSVTIVGFSASLMLLGTIGAWGRARGPYAMMAVGTTLWTLFTIATSYGMTRFRLPLEAMWTVYLAMFLANPAACIEGLRQESWRLFGMMITVPPVFALMLWYLPTGFPSFW